MPGYIKQTREQSIGCGNGDARASILCLQFGDARLHGSSRSIGLCFFRWHRLFHLRRFSLDFRRLR